MEPHGLAVYTPPSSQDRNTWDLTGPRFYVSITSAAWKRFADGAPAPPDHLADVLWWNSTDCKLAGKDWPNMIRGVGWALAPPHSDPQSLHADIWGEDPRPGRVRFHHLLWKRRIGECCTTQLVPGGFTDG